MQLRFLDSYSFLPQSIDNLASTLSDDQCVEITKHFKEKAKIDLIRQKGVFPYSYLTNVNKLKDTQLPSKDRFFNLLKDEHISDSDYQKAHNVCNFFKCKTLGDI